MLYALSFKSIRRFSTSYLLHRAAGGHIWSDANSLLPNRASLHKGEWHPLNKSPGPVEEARTLLFSGRVSAARQRIGVFLRHLVA